MKLFIDRDFFDSPKPPAIYLCNTGKKIIGQLPAYETKGTFKWNTYSEIEFSIDRTYVDLIDGTTKIHPLFDKVESPRNIYITGYGYFSIEDVNTVRADKDTKTVTCFSYERSTLANKYLNNFRCNTGNIDSIEVMYNEKRYGYDYVIDQDKLYSPATGAYKSDESYYIKEYVDKSFVWEQVQVKNADDYATYFGEGANNRTPLHIRNYPNVRFYWESNQELSLVHLVLANAPEWRVGHVDATLWRKERKFDEDRIDIYSFLTNNIADTFKCVVVFDSIEGTVNFYEESDDGFTEDGTIDDLWDSNVVISKDNLASSIEVKYSADDIRTKLKLSSSDGVYVREVNLGSDYIMNLDFYHNEEWMEQDLFEAYSRYLEANKTYAPLYEAEMKKWIAANNKYTEVMNAVPAENDVVMIDDVFEKLYCMFGAINTAFVTPDIEKDLDEDPDTVSAVIDLYFDNACTEKVDKSKISDGDIFVVQGYNFIYSSESQTFAKGDDLATTTLSKALIEKLNLYGVDEDVRGTVQDNILLTLKNTNSDTATIRIYAPKIKISTSSVPYDDNQKYYTQSGTTEETFKYTYVPIKSDEYYSSYEELYINNYTISCVVVSSSGITTAPFYGTLTDWLRGKLTAHKMGLVSADEETGSTTPNFTVKYIGTMGAYLVISKNEYVYTNDEWVPSEDYLRQYGVNLLKEKANTYLKIFQTQTEAMYQDDGYQCVAQDAEPHGGNVPEGTRWFKTNGQPPTLYRRNNVASTVWTERWDEFIEEENEANYKNYQRYMDNFQKMTVTSKVLQEQERKAEYLLSGYAVTDNPVNVNDLKGQSLAEVMQKAAITHFCGTQAYASGKVDGSSAWDTIDTLYFNTYKEGGIDKYINPIDKTKLANGARYVVNKYAYQYNSTTDKFERKYRDVYITPMALEEEYPLLPFTIADEPFSKAGSVFDPDETYYIESDNGLYVMQEVANKDDFETYNGKSKESTLYVRNLYAVYLQGTTPYIAYYSSQGVHQMKKDYIANQAALEKFFNEDQWIRLSPFIREDEYTNDDIITIEYDSEEEKNRIFKEFVEEASKELKTLSQPSLEFSMTMANLLASPEFESLVDQFQLGKFIRVDINGDYSKRARLLEVSLSFDDLSDFSCVFGDLKTTKDQVNLHAELLEQAVQAGSTVAQKQEGWQSAVDTSNRLEESIANGLRDAALSVSASSGQNIVWDQRGIVGRKLVDGTTDQYYPEQFMLTNNKLVFTSDGFQTAKSAFGKFYITDNSGHKVEKWGLLSDAVVSGYISGSVIEGGSLKIGGQSGDKGTFIVNEDGSVQILGPQGEAKYAAKALEKTLRFQTTLKYDGQTIFYDRDNDECIITCEIYDNSTNITAQVLAQPERVFTWSNSSYPNWTVPYVLDANGKPIDNQIKIKPEHINRNAQITCSVKFDETVFNTEDDSTIEGGVSDI